MKIILIIRALFGTPFLLVGNFFNGIADIIIGKTDSQYDDDKISRKYAESIIGYFWGILIFLLVLVGLSE
jgi:hypothetical protein